MIDDEVKRAIEVMREGGVILYPTDTVWGIGCDATNADAVRRVYELKQRDESKAMICLVDSADRLSRYVRRVPQVVWDMVDLATQPLTVVYDNVSGVAPNLTSDDGSVAFRVTHEEFSHQLCYRFQKPIVSTSANRSGEPTPRIFSEISDEVKNAVDYVVRYNQRSKEKHQPSRIIKVNADGQFKIIR